MLVFKPADNSSNQKILHCLALLKAKDSLITYIHTYIETLYYDSSIRGYSVIIYNNNKKLYNNKITMGQKKIYLHLLQQEIFT